MYIGNDVEKIVVTTLCPLTSHDVYKIYYISYIAYIIIYYILIYVWNIYACHSNRLVAKIFLDLRPRSLHLAFSSKLVEVSHLNQLSSYHSLLRPITFSLFLFSSVLLNIFILLILLYLSLPFITPSQTSRSHFVY